MATYKVIQDIEAEDKLVGPLTLRQFIFAAIAALCAYLSFLALTKGFSVALIVLIPPMLFTGFFAFPWGRDQPAEIWALAKIRFYIKSRKRLWDQSGVKDLVTITAPKRDTRIYTNGLSEHEVQSRLTALAHTLDTRGWAVKNVYSVPQLGGPVASDRLLDISAAQPMPVVGITDADDMLDETNNPRAHQLQQMVDSSTASHKQQLLDHMRQGALSSLPAPAMQSQASNQWFTTQPIDMPSPQPAPAKIIDDTALAQELQAHQKQADVNEHLKTIQPLQATPLKPQPATPVAPVTAPQQPATMNLSQLAMRDDLTVQALSRIAKGEDKATIEKKASEEVVISLHKHD